MVLLKSLNLVIVKIIQLLNSSGYIMDLSYYPSKLVKIFPLLLTVLLVNSMHHLCANIMLKNVYCSCISGYMIYDCIATNCIKK